MSPVRYPLPKPGRGRWTPPRIISPAAAPPPIVGPFYTPADPFRALIPGSPAIDVNSAAYAATIASNGGSANFVNTPDWGYPIVQAAITDPQFTIAGTTFYTGTNFTFRIPAWAMASTGSDQHLVVISPDGLTETDFWGFAWSGGVPTARSVWQNDISVTSGLSMCQPVGGVYGSSQASHFGLLAGTILASEMAAGAIPHALAFTIPQTATTFRYPAQASDGTTVTGTPVPMGVQLQLDPAFNVTTLAAWLQPIAVAMQNYGAYLTDTGGSLGLIAESPATGTYPASTDTWLDTLPWATSMRVLAVAAPAVTWMAVV